MSKQPSWMSALEQRHQKRLRTTEPKPRRPVRVPGGKATFFAMLAIMCTIFTSLIIFNEVQRARRDGVEASGVVVKRWSGSRNGYVDVVFTTSTGRRVQASINDDEWGETPKVGTRVQVQYVPSRPEDTAVNAQRSMVVGIMGPVFLLSFTSLFATLAFVTWRQTRAAGARKSS